MGIIKTVLETSKGVVEASKVITSKGGMTKNDVKVAKLELQREKEARKNFNKMSKKQKREYLEEQQRKKVEENAQKLMMNSKVNIENQSKLVLKLALDTLEILGKVTELTSKGKTTFSEKIAIRRNKDEARENLKYLYLAKDYFSYAKNLAYGISIGYNKNLFIVDFAPFFDGIKVLNARDSNEYDEDDDSLFGELRGIGKEFMAEIFGDFAKNTQLKSHFDFNEHLQIYSKEIDKLIMPDFKSALLEFKNVKLIDNTIEVNEEKTIENEIKDIKKDKINSSSICPNCNEVIEGNYKFCPGCGAHIEVKRPKFCPECGTTLKGENKFCPECGKKII